MCVSVVSFLQSIIMFHYPDSCEFCQPNVGQDKDGRGDVESVSQQASKDDWKNTTEEDSWWVTGARKCCVL